MGANSSKEPQRKWRYILSYENALTFIVFSHGEVIKERPMTVPPNTQYFYTGSLGQTTYCATDNYIIDLFKEENLLNTLRFFAGDLPEFPKLNKIVEIINFNVSGEKAVNKYLTFSRREYTRQTTRSRMGVFLIQGNELFSVKDNPQHSYLDEMFMGNGVESLTIMEELNKVFPNYKKNVIFVSCSTIFKDDASERVSPNVLAAEARATSTTAQQPPKIIKSIIQYVRPNLKAPVASKKLPPRLLLPAAHGTQIVTSGTVTRSKIGVNAESYNSPENDTWEIRYTEQGASSRDKPLFLMKRFGVSGYDNVYYKLRKLKEVLLQSSVRARILKLKAEGATIFFRHHITSRGNYFDVSESDFGNMYMRGGSNRSRSYTRKKKGLRGGDRK